METDDGIQVLLIKLTSASSEGEEKATALEANLKVVSSTEGCSQ